MLRINSKDSPNAAKAYYTGTQRGDYYTEDSEIIGNWGGKGAARLGLSGTVNREAFAALCDNLHPTTGEQLTPRMKDHRIVGYDFTFDVPKSVSILYGLSNDRRILEAYRKAVEATLIEMEDEVQTRVRRDGEKDSVRTTGNMVRAEFIHLTTRPVDGIPDPQLHSHIFALNCTFDEVENRWKAANFRQIKKDSPYYQAAFHSRMSFALQRMGLSITRKGRAFEVYGVPESAIQRFSRRTGVIEAEAARRGITDADEKAKLGALTREPKAKDLTPRQLTERWLEMATSQEREAILAVLGRIRTPHLEPRELGEMAKTVAAHPTRPVQYSGVHPALPDTEPHPFELTQEQRAVVDQAILHCFSHESVVREKQLKAAILWYGVESVRVAELDKLMAAVPELVCRTLDGQRMVTTEKVIAEERRMVDWVRGGKGAMEPLAAGHVIRNKKLGEDQRTAVKHILESTDRVTGVEGRAGTGKTTLMREAIPAIEARGQKVVVLAPTADASRGILRDDGFKEANTVERWLGDMKWQQLVGDDAVWWIDEAGLLSSRDMVRLVALAQKTNARVVLSGDTHQHHAVVRGDAMRTLKTHAELSLAEVTTVRRQEGIYKEVVENFSKGCLEEGFAKLDGINGIVELPSDERYAAVANEYLEAAKAKEKIHIVCPTHSEIRKVVNAIRDELKDQGQLQGQQEVEIYRPLHMNDAAKADLRSFKPGQALVMKKSAPGLMPGDRLKIVETHPDVLRVELKDGRVRTFDPKRIAKRFEVYEPDVIGLAPGDKIVTTEGGRDRDGARFDRNALHTVKRFTSAGDIELEKGLVIPREFKHLRHGYATTSYVAQGKTTGRVIVVDSSESFVASSREQFYVSISRGMKDPKVYTDSKEELFDAVSRSSERMAALDLLDGTEPERAVATQPEPQIELSSARTKDALDTKMASHSVPPAQERVVEPEEAEQPQKSKEKFGNIASVVYIPNILATRPTNLNPSWLQEATFEAKLERQPETLKDKLGRLPRVAHVEEIHPLKPSTAPTPTARKPLATQEIPAPPRRVFPKPSPAKRPERVPEPEPELDLEPDMDI